MPDDLYSLLGLKIGCTMDDIKQAYRKMARLYHPDVNKSPQAPEMMKLINAAYAILSDTEKRKMYDYRAYASMAGQGFRNTGPKVDSKERRYANASYGGPQRGYTRGTSHANVYVPSNSRIKMYAIFLAIFVLSSFYLFVLPFVYSPGSPGIFTSFSATGPPAHANAMATASPGPSMSPTPMAPAIVQKPLPTITSTPTTVPITTPGPAPSSTDRAHVKSMAPQMAASFGSGIVAGRATINGNTLLPGNSYIAICDADNATREYYSTVTGPTGYFQFAAVNNTIGADGSPEKRYILYARNNKTKSEAYSPPFGVEPYRITNIDVELAAA